MVTADPSTSSHVSCQQSSKGPPMKALWAHTAHWLVTDGGSQYVSLQSSAPPYQIQEKTAVQPLHSMGILRGSCQGAAPAIQLTAQGRGDSFIFQWLFLWPHSLTNTKKSYTLAVFQLHLTLYLLPCAALLLLIQSSSFWEMSGGGGLWSCLNYFIVRVSEEQLLHYNQNTKLWKT